MSNDTILILEETIASPAVSNILSDGFNVCVGLQRFNNELANGKLHESDVVGIFARLGVELSSTFLQPFTGLEFVGTVTTGVTHIDIDFLAQKNIKLFTLHDCRRALENITGTSELAITLALALHHNLIQANTETAAGKWDRKPFFRYQLNGQTAGIIGFGRIGSRIAKTMHSMGVNVVFCDTETKTKSEFAQVCLEELLRNSNLIFVTANYTPGEQPLLLTKHQNCLRLRPILVNVARGQLIDERFLSTH